MSKELVNKAITLQAITCLNSLLDRANHDEYLARIGKKEALKFLEENEKYVDIIKLNLQRLESIENAKPSEALEELFKTTYFGSKEEYDKINNCYNNIKQALLKAQEQEKENAKYKQLDEQLGCPLDVVKKAIKNGIYNGVPEYISAVGLVYINNFYGFMLTCFNKNGEQTGCYPTSEYKKTWWLKEDKSE